MALALDELLSRAHTDPEFLQALAADPLGTAVAAGVRVTSNDVKTMLGIDGATDSELVEVLRQRLAHGLRRDGCGLCGEEEPDEKAAP